MKDVTLTRGQHRSRHEGMCAMEFAAYLAGERHSDSPRCVDPVLRGLLIGINDGVNDEQRQRLRPYIARALGTATDGVRYRRGMIKGWMVERVGHEFFAHFPGIAPERLVGKYVQYGYIGGVPETESTRMTEALQLLERLLPLESVEVPEDEIAPVEDLVTA